MRRPPTTCTGFAVIAALAATAQAQAPAAGTHEPAAQTHEPSAQSHWAFVAPERPAVPSTDAECRNEVDAFVAARLERAGLRLAAEADRRTLIRRLSLDLVGLPPTPEEVDAFVADERPDAYERLVDDLLARPQYGERMALRWLDLARYADTNGYSIDGGRHMWAWRDWVIDAYNDNMPFDRFTVEQLAGDLLPDATADQRIATGFNRNHMITHEGGTILEEYRVAYVADRVRTTATTWMGLTLGCAQCHDHKYDPLSQRDYYRFFAYFNSIPEKGNDGDGGVNPVPSMPVYDDEQRAALARLADELAARRAELLGPDDELDAAQRAWEREQTRLAPAAPRLGPWSAAGPFVARTADAAFTNDFGPEAGGDVSWRPAPELVDGEPLALTGARSAWYFRRRITAARATTAELSFGKDDALRVWLDGALVVDENTRGGVAPDEVVRAVELAAGEHELLLKVVNDGGPGGVYFRMRRSGPPDEVAAALARAEGDRDDGDRAALRGWFRRTTPALAAARAAITALEAEVRAIEASPATSVMVMQELATPRETFVLRRGSYDLRGERVTPGTPASLPPLPEGASNDRLGLARWLVDPRHPLTARVAVNHLWQTLFGDGIVRTSEDFGTQGEPPSHPALLDWLAVEFVDSGWDVKAMLRRLVTSRVYRQSSRCDPAALARDPDNRLLARGPSFRLSAELIRDQALAVSGLLVQRVGGPSARPYQPAGLWLEMSHYGSTPATEQVYVQDHGDGLHRRSLYTIWKRTVPPPPMVAFDAPNREWCTPRRGRTNTPLQALVLLNETGFVEAARGLAARILREAGADDADRVARGFTLVTARAPGPDERDVLLAAIARERARFAADPAAARALLAVGEAAAGTGVAPAELAAWTVVASVLLNLSETVTKG